MNAASALKPNESTAGEKIASAESALDALQHQLDAVLIELEQLRHRDTTLQSYMRRLDEELKLAARVQQDFLPKSLPHVGQVRFHTLFRPAAHVSGDLYDVMRLDESHVGFYMADAVGHGMPAALLTMFLKQALVTKDIQPGGYRLLPPAQTMARLNDALVEQNLSQATFATAVYGYMNTRTLQLTFSRGGHPNPLLLTAAGELQTLETEGSLLGIFPGETFNQTCVQLSPGDRVLIYSDGIEVAFSGAEACDPNCWRDEVLSRSSQTTDQIMRDLAELVDRCPHNEKRDDVTLIGIDVSAA